MQTLKNATTSVTDSKSRKSHWSAATVAVPSGVTLLSVVVTVVDERILVVWTPRLLPCQRTHCTFVPPLHCQVISRIVIATWLEKSNTLSDAVGEVIVARIS